MEQKIKDRIEAEGLAYEGVLPRHADYSVAHVELAYERGLEKGAEIALEEMPKWVSVEERMPDKNVGVLVFLPAEDNHITSGMFDISGAWVLLDEYRTPFAPVTHWMPLPLPPNVTS